MKKYLILITLLISMLAPFQAFSQDYADALEKGIWFFDANRCGPDAGEDNVFSSWRGACHTSDSDGGIDLTGGYHDAGDHVKFGLPQGWSAATLGWALYEFRAAFDNTGTTAKTLSVLKYFTDYFLKSHPDANTFYYHVGDGNADHGYWGPPELQTGTRPTIKATPSSSASDVTATTAAALALMYLNYRDVDSSYADRCLQAAKELYKIAQYDTGRSSDGSGGNFYKSSSHYDDMAWGAIWLTIATGDNSYLNPIENWLDTKQNDYGDDNYDKHWAPAWDDVTVYVLIKMYQLTGLEKYKQGVLNNLEWYRDELRRTPFGLPWLDSWGVLRYASAEAGAGYMAMKYLDYDGYFETANFSMDYILGDNPRGKPYLSNWNGGPQHPHHRANEPNRDGNTNGMLGALVGGPDNGDGYRDDVNDYILNEVAIDYNASFVIGMAGYIYYNTSIVTKYTLTVNSGTGDGTYPAGKVVEIKGTKPSLPINQKAVFSHWSGDTANVANIYAETTTFTMPESNASVTANYDIIDVVVYELTAENATGSGFYEAGEVVAVAFDSPYVHPWETITFKGWSGDTQYLASTSAQSTTLTMPAADVSIKAEYDVDSIQVDFFEVPGKIEAEDYQDYYDTTSGNITGAYRNDDVDIEDSGNGGYNIAYIDAGEWTAYYINVENAGTFDIELRVALADSGSGYIHIEIDGEDVSGPMEITPTGGWQTYVTLTAEDVAISKGQKVLKLCMDEGPFNLDCINFVQVGGNVFPKVNISSPSNGDVFYEGADITITASASDTDGSVAMVDFYANGTKIGSDSTYPYSIIMSDVSIGSYELTAVVTDNEGAATTSAPVGVSVIVEGENVPPTVSITAPANNAEFYENSDITITASAADSDGSVAMVDFYVNGTKIGSDSTYPYSIVMPDAAIGTYELTAVATDNEGATTTSSGVSIKVVEEQQENDIEITYNIVNDWYAGFQGEIIITNNSNSTVNGWELAFTFPGNQQINNSWGGIATQAGQSVTIVNEAWNGTIQPGQSVTVGFIAIYSGTNTNPAQFTFNGQVIQ